MLLDKESRNTYGTSTDYVQKKEVFDDQSQVSLIIVVYSAVDPRSCKFVRKCWDLSRIKHCNPTTPIVLVGCNGDQRKEIQKSKKTVAYNFKKNGCATCL